MSRTWEEKGNPMSFAVQVGGLNSGGDKAAVYSHCNREGHNLGTCFQLIEYPDYWGNRPRSSTSGQGSGCKRNGGGGHDRSGIPRANVTQTFATEDDHRGVTKTDRKGPSGLNDEQWSILLGLLSS